MAASRSFLSKYTLRRFSTCDTDASESDTLATNAAGEDCCCALVRVFTSPWRPLLCRRGDAAPHGLALSVVLVSSLRWRRRCLMRRNDAFFALGSITAKLGCDLT